MIKKLFIFAFVMIAGFCLIGCEEEQKVPANLEIDYQTLELEVDSLHTFEVTEEIIISSSNESVVIGNNDAKVITALSEGLAVVTISLKNDPTVYKEIVVTVTVPQNNNQDGAVEEIVIENPVDSLFLDDNYTLQVKVLPEGANQEVIFKAANKTRATIDETGKITCLLDGEATFQVFSIVDPSVTAQITIDIKSYINPDKFIESLIVENPVLQNIRVTGFQYVYYHKLTGGITNYLFEDLNIIQALIPQGNANRPGVFKNGFKFEAKYVTFHDTANASAGAKNHASYWAGSGVTTSCHFTTGNDGVYQLLPYNEVAYHAGDGTSTKLTFTDTKIKAPEGSTEPAKVTISSDGFFMMNGEKTTISVPRKDDGTIPTNANLPYTGINNYVDSTTGTYWISNTWWSSTYKVVSNRGGNLNSIGIESCVDDGSNLYYTWALSAKLIGQAILPTTGLDVGDVKQHNTFSGKDCPMTMRDAKRWETFIDMCTAEYNKATYFNDWTITLNCDSPYVDSNGLIKSLPTTATKVNFTITFSNGTDFNKTYTFSSTIPADL